MRRKPLLLVELAAALASVALVVAGCGGGSAKPSVASLGSKTAAGTHAPATGSSGAGSSQGQSSSSGKSGGTLSLAGSNLAALSRCMRSHGEPNFPDPNAQGQIDASGIDPQSPQFQHAQQACHALMKGQGQAPTPAQLAKVQKQMLAYSSCMRSHGVPSFPDPTFSGGAVQMKLGASSGVDPRSPQFQAAQKACAGHLPGRVGTALGKALPGKIAVDAG